jgi:hypothetical protein
MKNCYNCEKPREKGHVCVPWTEPSPGTSFRLERYRPDPTGFTGDFAVDVIDAAGKTVAGILSSREECERLLLIRGFKRPFYWPTVAESEAERKQRRKKK